MPEHVAGMHARSWRPVHARAAVASVVFGCTRSELNARFAALVLEMKSGSLFMFEIHFAGCVVAVAIGIGPAEVTRCAFS